MSTIFCVIFGVSGSSGMQFPYKTNNPTSLEQARALSGIEPTRSSSLPGKCHAPLITYGQNQKRFVDSGSLVSELTKSYDSIKKLTSHFQVRRLQKITVSALIERRRRRQNRIESGDWAILLFAFNVTAVS
ncbi:MAG: hypothetical protein AAB401_03560 [Acidobacteriota bacterium]